MKHEHGAALSLISHLNSLLIFVAMPCSLLTSISNTSLATGACYIANTTLVDLETNLILLSPAFCHYLSSDLNLTLTLDILVDQDPTSSLYTEL